MRNITVTVVFEVAVSDNHHTPGCAESLRQMVSDRALEWAKDPRRMFIAEPTVTLEERP